MCFGMALLDLCTWCQNNLRLRKIPECTRVITTAKKDFKAKGQRFPLIKEEAGGEEERETNQ